MKLESPGAAVARGDQVKPSWSEVAALAALLLFALVMAHGWPWPTQQTADAPKITDWLTAIGTVGAVFAAILVPLFQNRDRRREQRRDKLQSEWSVAEGVYRISARLCEIANCMKKSVSPQSLTELSHLQSQLTAAKLATTDRVGHLIIDDLLYVLVCMHDESSRRASGVSQLHAAAVSLGTAKPFDDETEININRLPRLRSQSLDWLERAIANLEKVGVVSSSVFRGSGKAVVKFHASGEGRAQRPNE